MIERILLQSAFFLGSYILQIDFFSRIAIFERSILFQRCHFVTFTVRSLAILEK